MPDDAPAQPPGSQTAQREHAQALYDRVIGWYESAERKAQLILTLDGVFLSFVATSAFRDPTDLRAATSQFGPETWLAVALMAVALTASIVSSVVALRSRMENPSDLAKSIDASTADPEPRGTYSPANTWFFQHLAVLDPERLGRTLAGADSEFAIRSLAVQSALLSRRVVEKHRWVNRGFFFAGAVLVCFLTAAVSYVVRAS